jgi:hypothetical protein
MMSRSRLLWTTFGMALAVRVLVVAATPRVNEVNSDLEINRMSGALIVAGVNPYDPRSGVALRAHLMDQTYSLTFKLTQANWDYVAGSLLPLNLLYLGAIEVFSHAPLWYRLVFALVDSVFATLAMLFVLLHWPGASRAEQLVAGWALGALSFVMLQWGVHSPQDKGTELLLIVAALLSLRAEGRLFWLILAPLVLGLSVAFKAIGICLVPLFLFRVYSRDDSSLSDLIVFVVIAGVAAVAWHLPYRTDWAAMMSKRFGDDLNFPRYASPFSLTRSPTYYITHYDDVIARALYARVAVAVVLVVATAIGMIRRTIVPEVATAALVILFVGVMLIAGGLDRINIGIVTAILLIGTHHRFARRVAVAFYVALGLVSAAVGFVIYRSEQRTEALGLAVGLALMMGFLIWLAVRPAPRRQRVPAHGRGRREPGRRLARHEMWLALACVVTPVFLAFVPKIVSPHVAYAEEKPLVWRRNPFATAWELNRAKSTFASGPKPKLEFLTCREDGDRIVATFERTSVDGRRTTIQYSAKYDGRDSPVVADGSRTIGDIALTRINEYIVDFVERRGGTTSATGTMTTSTDSKTLIVRRKGVNADGTTYEDVLVYDKL